MIKKGDRQGLRFCKENNINYHQSWTMKTKFAINEQFTFGTNSAKKRKKISGLHCKKFLNISFLAATRQVHSSGQKLESFKTLLINSWHHNLELVTLRSCNELQGSATRILRRRDHRRGRCWYYNSCITTLKTRPRLYQLAMMSSRPGWHFGVYDCRTILVFVVKIAASLTRGDITKQKMKLSDSWFHRGIRWEYAMLISVKGM